ncbi:MAG: hypothetical protein V7L25_16500 [Nostoc sp.]
MNDTSKIAVVTGVSQELGRSTTLALAKKSQWDRDVSQLTR